MKKKWMLTAVLVLAAVLLAGCTISPDGLSRLNRLAQGQSLTDSDSDTVTISRDLYERYRQFDELLELMDVVDYYYYQEPNVTDMLQGASAGLLAGLQDPYTFYYTPEAWKKMKEDDEGEYAGVGILISSNYKTGVCTISRVFRGSPAETAGVQRGDILYRIGEDLFVVPETLQDAVDIMRGTPGTSVDVTFLRDGEEITFNLTRANITVNQVESTMLTEEIGKNLAAGEQTILLVNRRGYNTFVVCAECKKVLTCPRCSISLTYHAANNRLMCHYCGYSVPYKDTCPDCGAQNIRYAGTGTQKIEQELKHRFPEARVLRMDADTTAARNAHDRMLSAFGRGEYDILLGTQMVAKGLDFPRVTLVGITSADRELYNDDFRCTECTFDLITQVVGRAGRGGRKGRAVIQTVTPDNDVIATAAAQDYKKYYATEILLRRAMIYPPYCDICVVGFTGADKGLVAACAASFLEELRRRSDTEYSDDFRSAENTFDLITQVIGRAGRASIAGRAFIQTQAPDNAILQLAAKQDYTTFFEQEIGMRKAMTYPPFCDLCEIGFSADGEATVKNAAAAFFESLVRLNTEEYGLRLIALGPLQPKVAKVNRLYRQKILIKCKNNARLRELISRTLKLLAVDKAYRQVYTYAVINPVSTS